mmetsp:Transcript_46040/g.131891  ORF Transcript_46040/g.131891 Transcript_46040/m.131891 type:complete len:245 (+) Transcript_46040:616-1350(+)
MPMCRHATPTPLPPPPRPSRRRRRRHRRRRARTPQARSIRRSLEIHCGGAPASSGPLLWTSSTPRRPSLRRGRRRLPPCRRSPLRSGRLRVPCRGFSSPPRRRRGGAASRLPRAPSQRRPRPAARRRAWASRCRGSSATACGPRRRAPVAAAAERKNCSRWTLWQRFLRARSHGACRHPHRPPWASSPRCTTPSSTSPFPHRRPSAWAPGLAPAPCHGILAKGVRCLVDLCFGSYFLFCSHRPG